MIDVMFGSLWAMLTSHQTVGLMEDKELQAKAEKLERPVELAYGNDVLDAIKEALNQTPETIAVLKAALRSGRRS